MNYKLWSLLYIVHISYCLHTYTCYMQILNMNCSKDHVILIESSHLTTKNHTIARLCNTRYDTSCDFVDPDIVSTCSGKKECRVLNNKDNQYCKYLFLLVEYSCIPVNNISRICDENINILNKPFGYISSPNYPMAYYNNAKCSWNIQVKKRQTIRIIIYDFRLNSKQENKCGDKLSLIPYVAGSSKSPEEYCSLMGFTTFNFSSTEVRVNFSSYSKTLPKAGFILRYEAIGPGCEDLPSLGNNTIVSYKMIPRAPVDAYLGPTLTANVTCSPGFFTYVDNGQQVSRIIIQCGVNDQWSHVISPCTDVVPEVTTERKNGQISDDTNFQNSSNSTSHIGTILGVVCSVISLLLLFSIIIYALRRRKKSNTKRDDWTKKNNDLQYTNQVNELREQSTLQSYYHPSKYTVPQKSYNYDYNNITNTDAEDSCCQYYEQQQQPQQRSRCLNCEDNVSHCGSLVGHAAGIPNDCRCRRSSAADLLDNSIHCCTPVRNNRSWIEPTSAHSCPKPNRSDQNERPLYKDRRSRSGQWNRGGATMSSKRSRSCEILDERRCMSTSAPDLANEANYTPTHPPPPQPIRNNNQGLTSFHTPRKLFY